MSPGDNEAGQVARAAARAGDAAGIGAFEAELEREAVGGEFLEGGERGRHGVDVHIGVEGGEEELGGEADGGGRGVELVEEALVPGVDGVVEEGGDCGEKAGGAGAGFGGEEGSEEGGEGCGWKGGWRGDEGVGGGGGGGAGCAVGGGGVGCTNEGDYEGFDGVDELSWMLARVLEVECEGGKGH